MKRRCLWIALLMLLLGIHALGADYTYTVRFFTGGQGSFPEGDVITYENLHYGDRVTFQPQSVTLADDSKYYIRGIRESGKDNNTVSATSFLVTGDQDYVVAYGILGSSVAYTVNYVDEAGNSLAPSETYYGNVGDRPVIAYLYMEGYQPQAYNLTRTLQADASANVFTFTYRAVTTTSSPAVSQAPGATGTTTETGTQGEAATDTETEIDTQPPDTQPGETIEPATQPADTSGTEATDPEEAPRELIDLDEDQEQVPLANQDLADQTAKTPHTTSVVIAAVVIVGALGIILILLLWWKRRKKEAQDGETKKE
jgi:hypothetical protein